MEALSQHFHPLQPEIHPPSVSIYFLYSFLFFDITAISSSYDFCTKQWHVSGLVPAITVYDISVQHAGIIIDGTQNVTSGQVSWDLILFGQLVVSDFSLSVLYRSADQLVAVLFLI